MMLRQSLRFSFCPSVSIASGSGRPAFEQHAQLLAEERHREALAAAAPGQAERALGAHAEHGVAAPLELAHRRDFVGGLEVERLDARRRVRSP